ncbi:NAD(P)/FAD-dependent oxidoreductase [Nitratifractor salsuginis]|uniref:HI0933 family protein n=1 Tax=Nitratifractor salsuginis (strain DSM 16511 / JCM 12458 / E9I37-1) TaxID=749222 RepID=E6WZR5_NITSE|nr:aminoacetone oxidase family FAD-binding enzyme [Nitratifractor salsuginis]ADV46706.1 HI0933 family protein [Nitratifractor salsuginis DSM 16511]
MKSTKTVDLAILGAGASGLMLASLLQNRKNVCLIDGNPAPGAKIAVSGGGRCNLCNAHLDPSYYRGDAKVLRSVFGRYDQHWLLRWFHERGVETRLEKGSQYFAKERSRAVLDALQRAARGVETLYGFRVKEIRKEAEGFSLIPERGRALRCRRLVIASGGLSFPKLGASGIGLEFAKESGHPVEPTAPALVGFTLQPAQAFFKSLSGVAVEAEVRVARRCWRDRLLFAHRGISGPAVLNASLWWERGEISIDFLPGFDLNEIRSERKNLSTLLPLPKRAALAFLKVLQIRDRPCRQLGRAEWERLEGLHDYRFAPAGTFGYSKAEVTRGGVGLSRIDPLTMESRLVPGLYFLGEVLDVTGELGGYNFQWAFSSAAVCAEALNE